MQSWAGFFTTIAAASATLLGLLFVAISVNASETLGAGHDDARRLAEQAFANYFAILMVALTALFPGISMRTLGLTTLYMTIGGGVWVFIRFWQSLRDAKQFESGLASARRHAISAAGFILLIYAALDMRFGHPGEVETYIFAWALMILAASATLASWKLLLRLSHLHHRR
jgi:hypothetical protein